jgi:hypothetical protein
MPLKTGNWCYQCGAYDTEPAGEKCKNPAWHVPLVPGTQERKDVRLPYAEEK